jgi:hypothetical protein
MELPTTATKQRGLVPCFPLPLPWVSMYVHIAACTLKVHGPRGRRFGGTLP